MVFTRCGVRGPPRSGPREREALAEGGELRNAELSAPNTCHVLHVETIIKFENVRTAVAAASSSTQPPSATYPRVWCAKICKRERRTKLPRGNSTIQRKQYTNGITKPYVAHSTIVVALPADTMQTQGVAPAWCPCSRTQRAGPMRVRGSSVIRPCHVFFNYMDSPYKREWGE
jgi:hypothetical protein